MLDWNDNMDAAPKDGSEVMLFYREWCGAENLVISGHWECHEGREFEATWAHSLGFGDAVMWATMPEGPDLTPLPGKFGDYLPTITPTDTPLMKRLRS